MENELNFDIINKIDIIEILNELWIPVNNRHEVFNPLFKNWYNDKYRVDIRKTNSVVNWWNEDLPTWKPYNFIKKYLKLEDREVFNWFKQYLWISFSNIDYFKNIEEKINKSIGNKNEELELLKRRDSIIKQFNDLNITKFSDNILKYFESRNISEEILLKNYAKIGVIKNNWKTYYNRIYFPMYNGEWIQIWVKARDIYAKPGFKKSTNITDSWTWLLFNKDEFKKSDYVFLVEWEIDKMTLETMWLRNVIWNLSWAQTYKQERNRIFEKFDKIYVFYDNDKNGAWLSWIINVMKNLPNKKIEIIDFQILIKENFKEEDWEELNEEFKDINDIVCFCKNLWYNNVEIWKLLKNSCYLPKLNILEDKLAVLKEINKQTKLVETYNTIINQDIKNFSKYPI